MKRVYIVLSTVGVGGAEKRFVDNWYKLLSYNLDIHLVMDQNVWEMLRRQPGYTDKLSLSEKLHILNIGGGRYRDFCRAANDFFESQPRNEIIHCPLAYLPGVHIRYGHRLVMSWVSSSMPPFNDGQWKLGLGAWAGFFAADHLDILNPENFRRINKYPCMKKKTSLTSGGTHVDTNFFKPLSKKINFVFLGRMEPEKQSLKFFELLPFIHNNLKSIGFNEHRFFIYGDGSEASTIKDLSRSALFRDLPVEFGFCSNPEQVLGEASVFFSLQRTSNYPSKVLAEAMASGAYPVVTEVGESALMLNSCCRYYFVPRDFSADDITNALVSYLSLEDDQRVEVISANSAFAARRFSPDTQAEYFAKIYRQVGTD